MQSRAGKKPWAGGGLPHSAQFRKAIILASPQKVKVNKNNNLEGIFLCGIEVYKEYFFVELMSTRHIWILHEVTWDENRTDRIGSERVGLYQDRNGSSQFIY
jgi:hypothetical protein